jgi:hypothetical protein
MGHCPQRGVVGFFARHVEQLLRVTQAGRQRVERKNRVFERLAFLAEFLCALAVAPDGGIFGEPYDFIQTLALGLVVKDTSAAPWRARRCRLVAWRWR